METGLQCLFLWISYQKIAILPYSNKNKYSEFYIISMNESVPERSFIEKLVIWIVFGILFVVMLAVTGTLGSG